MSTQTTKNITRESAIDRINTIRRLVEHRDYRSIEFISNEFHDNLSDFVRSEPTNLVDESWSDRMLEDLMDEPFYRYSMFDNYLIEG